MLNSLFLNKILGISLVLPELSRNVCLVFYGTYFYGGIEEKPTKKIQIFEKFKYLTNAKEHSHEKTSMNIRNYIRNI